MTTKADLLSKAVETAALWHSGQFDRQGTTPQIFHCTRVADNVWRDERIRLFSEEQQLEIRCAAVLHDILEDTAYPDESLYREFGRNVWEMVLQLTKRSTVTYKEYIRAISLPGAILVKFADIKDNTSAERLIDNSRGTLRRRYNWADTSLQIRWRELPITQHPVLP